MINSISYYFNKSLLFSLVIYSPTRKYLTSVNLKKKLQNVGKVIIIRVENSSSLIFSEGAYHENGFELTHFKYFPKNLRPHPNLSSAPALLRWSNRAEAEQERAAFENLLPSVSAPEIPSRLEIIKCFFSFEFAAKNRPRRGQSALLALRFNAERN